MKKSGLLLVALLAATASIAQALEIFPASNWESPKEKKSELFKPAAFAMFGFDYRADEHNDLYISPGFIADLLLQINPALGLKGGIGYNAVTRYTGIDGIRTYSADIALHIEIPGKVVRPFLDGGIKYMKYEATGSDISLREGKTGLFAGVGLSIPLNRNNRIDLGINTLLNNVDNAVYTSPLPDDAGPHNFDRPIDGTGSYRFGRQLYNPLTLEIEMRLKL